MSNELPTPQGVIDAAWNLCRHGPNYDGRITDVEAAARAYAARCITAAQILHPHEFVCPHCFDGSRITDLDHQVDGLRALLGHIGAIAHCGGLSGLSEAEALVMVRRLTLEHWNRQANQLDQLRAVALSVEAATQLSERLNHG